MTINFPSISREAFCTHRSPSKPCQGFPCEKKVKLTEPSLSASDWKDVQKRKERHQLTAPAVFVFASIHFYFRS